MLRKNDENIKEEKSEKNIIKCVVHLIAWAACLNTTCGESANISEFSKPLEIYS